MQNGDISDVLYEVDGKLREDQIDELLDILDFIERVQGTNEWKHLQSKTQVFNEAYLKNMAQKQGGYSVKTRGTHSYDVAAIAKTLVESLEPDNIVGQYYAYLTGLIHDLGHIAFGHAGESIADKIVQSADMSEEEKQDYLTVRTALFGEDYKSKGEICFEHNENSVYQYAMMCNRFNIPFKSSVVKGILAHSTSRVKDVPSELFQQAVRLADKIAYVNYDVQDMITSFQNDPARLDALMSIYSEGLKDPDGNDITVPAMREGGVSVLEFLGIVDSNGKKYDEIKYDSIAERLAMMIEESVNDARKMGRLTGCQDILVAQKDVSKKIKNAKKSLANLEANSVEYNNQSYELQQFLEEAKKLDRELYSRNPLLYCFYQIKDRSDGLIQRSQGLNSETIKDMNKRAVSSVGNEDEKNEMIYKELVDILKQFSSGLFKIDKSNPLYFSYENLFKGYLKFKEEQVSALNVVQIQSGVNSPAMLPEICMMVNYIGTFSNSQLTDLAKKFGIVDKFEKQYQQFLENEMNKEEYYDNNHSLNESGKDKKNEIKNNMIVSNLLLKVKKAIDDVNELMNYYSSNSIIFDNKKLVSLNDSLISIFEDSESLYSFPQDKLGEVEMLVNDANKEVFLSIQQIHDDKYKQQCLSTVMGSKQYISSASFGR